MTMSSNFYNTIKLIPQCINSYSRLKIFTAAICWKNSISQTRINNKACNWYCM